MPNVVPFLSTNTLGADLAKAVTIYGNTASLSFRQAAKYSLSPLPFIDRRNLRGSKAFQFYMMSDTPAAQKEYQSGDTLDGDDYALGTGTVNVDEIIAKAGTIGERDQLISHIDMAKYIGMENGRKVALELDYRILNQLAICARQSAITDSGTGLTIAPAGTGIRVQRAGGSATIATALATAYPLSATGAANLASDLITAAYNADVAQWPMDARWMILDAYLLQVMQFDSSGKWFSKDYQETNSILNRNVRLLPGGWKVYAFETRTAQGGLMPDTNQTGYAISTKFNQNFLPGASNGYPCAIGFCAAGEDQAAVGFGTWQAPTTRVYGPEVTQNHTTKLETYCLTGIEKMRHYSATSIEVTSN